MASIEYAEGDCSAASLAKFASCELQQTQDCLNGMLLDMDE